MNFSRVFVSAPMSLQVKNLLGMCRGLRPQGESRVISVTSQVDRAFIFSSAQDFRFRTGCSEYTIRRSEDRARVDAATSGCPVEVPVGSLDQRRCGIAAAPVLQAEAVKRLSESPGVILKTVPRPTKPAPGDPP